MQLQRQIMWQMESWFGPKRPDQADLSERYGKIEQGRSNHPYTRESGRKGASNVWEDDIAGSE
ncbi:MAG: hypothetical protein QM778_24645 [Myxococcales bacterium]